MRETALKIASYILIGYGVLSSLYVFFKLMDLASPVWVETPYKYTPIKPGSDVVEGWYWLKSPSKLVVVRIKDYTGDIKPHCWKSYPESWTGHVLYGPIPQPEVTA